MGGEVTITKNATKKIFEIAYKKYLENQELNHFLSLEDEIIYSDYEKLAESFIEELPPQQKEIFLLAKKENLSNKEIAEKLSISLRTVENQIYRATKKIKEELRKNGVIISLVIPFFLFLKNLL